jgi:hypothetical protein
LSELSDAERAEVLRSWRSLLAPHGRVLLVNRLRPAADARPARFGASEARAFAEAVEARLRPFEPEDACAIGREAEHYARSRIAYPLRSAEEARALFEAAGLAVVEMSRERSEPAAGAPAGPTAPQGAQHLCVVAELL